MHRNHKPIRKCHNCPLNLGDRCAIYESPHDQWHDKDKCPGYMNEVLLAEYERTLSKQKVDHKRGKRQEEMKLCATAPHYQGSRAPGRR